MTTTATKQVKRTKQRKVQSTYTFGINPRELWYAPDRQVRTTKATRQAEQIAKWILTGEGLEEEPNEHELFVALNTCAYQAARETRTKKMTAAQRAAWARRWYHVREYIVEKNLGLVYLMIRRFRPQALDEDDLLSEAMYGLSRAVERFNPWKGYRFSTYACNAMARGLMRRGKGESRYRKHFPVQHDVTFEQTSELPDFGTELYVERLKNVLDQNLCELTDLESTVLAQRFPRDHGPRQTFQQIGKMVGLSKERVRQVQNIALQKLREVLDEDSVLQ